MSAATSWRARHPHVSAFGLFVLVIGGVYWPVVDGTRSLITNGPWSQPLFVIDALAGGPITAPLTRLAAASWRHLQLPVFDPFQGYGVPLLANQGVPVYPPQLVAHLLFPGNYSLWLVLDVLALAFGMYLLARAFGQRFWAAMAAGFLVALAGAAPPNVNMSVLNPLAVLPFTLVAVRYAADPRSAHRRSALLGIVTSVALLCLSGFQEVLPLMAVVIVVYTTALFVHYRTWQAGPLRILSTVAAAGTGVLIGCVGILPTLAAVNGGGTLNGPTSYLSHLPTYWLSTLVFPTVTGRALNQAPTDLGNTVSILGTPLLVFVVVLALVVALRRAGAQTRWYVLPSVTLVVFGVLGYANLGHVLGVMDLPVFDRIRSERFLQFAWWVPLGLLAGTVIDKARVLAWRDILLGLVAAGAFGGYFYEGFLQALAASHVATNAAVVRAPVVAVVVVVGFAAAVGALRWLGSGLASLAMAAVVLTSCIYDLPTNFAPSAYDAAVASVAVPTGTGGAGSAGSAGEQLAYFGPGTRQLPTSQFSVQLYGPLVPVSYAATLQGLFSDAQSHGVGPLYPAQPALADVTLTPRTVSVLRSLGVDLLVLSAPLDGAGFASIPTCAGGGGGPSGLVCAVGAVPSPAPSVGYSPPTYYVYRILGADPLVEPTTALVPVASTAAAVAKLVARESVTTTAMPSTAFVTTQARTLRMARGVHGISRHATTESVSLTVHCANAGFVVVRESYETGMHASVDGHRAVALPVDGGLWTAVKVGAGRSAVVLDYVTTAELVEFVLAAAGLCALVLAWGIGGLVLIRRRRRRTRSFGDAAARPSSPRPVARAG